MGLMKTNPVRFQNEKSNIKPAGVDNASGGVRSCSQVVSHFERCANAFDCKSCYSLRSVLVKKKPRCAFAFFVKKLQSGSTRERAIAAAALSQVGHQLNSAMRRQVVNILINAVTKDPCSEVRLSATSSLGLLKAKSVIPELIRAALNEDDEEVRLQIVKTLKEIDAKRAVSILIEALKFTTEKSRVTAAWLLQYFKDARVAPAFIGALKDPSPLVKLLAINVLAEDRDLRAVDALIRRLKDSNRVVRFYTVAALGLMRSKKAVPGLIEVLKKDEDLNVRRLSSLALSEIGGPVVVNALSRLIFIQDRSLSKMALNTLAAIGSIEAGAKILFVAMKVSMFPWSSQFGYLKEMAWQAFERMYTCSCDADPLPKTLPKRLPKRLPTY